MTDTQAIAKQIGAEKLWEALGAPPERVPAHLNFDRGSDELLEVSVRDYVRLLTGHEVPEFGRMDCPLPDHDDHSRDFTIVRESQARWYCWGCNRGGSVYDFAAALWGMGDRGASFTEMHETLVRTLGK